MTVSTPRTFTDVTVTDADGRYVFTKLPAGRYSVSFTKAGFVSLQYGQRHPFDEPKAVDLRNGQVLDKVDVALPRAGAIEGRVFDETGEPVAEATVHAMRVRYVDGERRVAPVGRTALTDDKGRYRVYGLPAGDYYISALVRALVSVSSPTPPAPSPGTSGYAPAFYPSAASPVDAQRVTVRAGEDAAAIDIVFRPTRLARVSGTMVTSSGKLLDGAYVSLAPARAIAPAGPLAFLGINRVAPTGTFTISGVPPGEYVLQARSIPASVVEEIARSGRVTSLTTAQEAEFAAVAITVTGQDVADLSITTSLPGRLRGRVTLDGPIYKPRAGAKTLVTAVPAGPDSLAAGPTGLLLADDGTFEIGGVVGTFMLRLRGLPPGVTLTRVEIGGRDIIDTGLTVEPREEVSDVELVLGSRATELMGHVLGAETTDTSRCMVIVFSNDPARWAWPATRYVGAARVESDGSFQAEGLPAGRYFAIAVAHVEPGQWLDPDYLKSLAGRATLVELKDGERQTVELRLNLR